LIQEVNKELSGDPDRTKCFKRRVLKRAKIEAGNW